MITFEKRLVSRVLVIDDDPGAQQLIKEFCGKQNLVGVRQTSGSIEELLHANIDLGAVLISENSRDDSKQLTSGLELANAIHALRKELPIFIRCADPASIDQLPAAERAAVAGAYSLDNMALLDNLVGQFLFDTEYPVSLVQRIEDVTQVAFHNTFKDIDVDVGLPYLVKDKLTYGDVLSLIPVESPWFGGYMMLQTEEEPMIAMLRDDRTSIAANDIDFRDVMGILSELSNQAWGGLKTKLLALPAPPDDNSIRIFVPITVNQYKEFISFGTDRAQLCFQYILSDKRGKLAPVNIYQKFIFNIKWLPEEFEQADANAVEDLMESGALELF